MIHEERLMSTEEGERLARQITLAAKAYYEGEPLISSEQFDMAVEMLRTEDPTHPLLSAPGWGYKPEGKLTAKHDGVVGSLDKTHDLEKLKRGDVLTPKLDGLSIVAYYDGGRLHRVLTRGDGTTGVLVTGRLNIPNHVNEEWIRAVRGEAVIGLEIFKTHLAAEYANPRNAVAGIVNALDSPYINLVSFIAYEITTNTGAVLEMDTITSDHLVPALKNNGFESAPRLDVDDPEKMTLASVKEWVESLGYPVDGAVHNAGEAIKFPTEAVDTKVVKINWNVSEKGKLIPVLEIEPVQLYGTTVTNVTAYHARFIKDYKIGPGAIVRVTKANEIIPHIIEVVEACKKVELPQGDWDGVHLVQVDDNEIERRRAIKFVRVLCGGIDGLGDIVIDELLAKATGDEKNVLSFLQFVDRARATVVSEGGGTYDFLFEGLTPGHVKLGAKMTQRFMTPIDRELLLFALSLDGVGETASQDLAPHLEAIVEAGTVHGHREHIKQNKAKAVSSINCKVPVLQACLETLTLSQIVQTKPVVLTGKMSKPRKTIVAMLKGLGYREVKTVTEETIVIADDPNGTSGKLKKARKVGARIMTEAEFFAQSQES
jgi:NAD-dependent DNA ligase